MKYFNFTFINPLFKKITVNPLSISLPKRLQLHTLVLANKQSLSPEATRDKIFSDLAEFEINSHDLNSNQSKIFGEDNLVQVLIQNHINSGDLERAIEALDLLLIRKNPRIDETIILDLMSKITKSYRTRGEDKLSCLRPQGLALVERVFKQIPLFGLSKTLPLVNVMIYAHVMQETPNMFKAIHILDESKLEPSVVTYTNLILGYVRARDMRMARKIYRRLIHQSNLRPTLKTFSVLILGAVRMRKLNLAMRFYYEMLSLEITPNGYIFGHLIYGYSRAKDFEEVIKLYKTMLDYKIVPSLRTTETLIAGLSQQRLDLAKLMINFLIDSQVPLNQQTFIIPMLRALDLREFDSSIKLWNLYLNYFKSPHVDLAEDLITRLLEQDLIVEVKLILQDLINSFEFNPSPKITLLLKEKGIFE